MKKFKFPLLAALLIAVAGVFAFTLPGKTAKKFTTYHYTGGSSFAEMQNPAFWEGVSPAEGCGNDGDIPCTVSTNEDIGEYLESFEDAGELLTAAVSKRD